MVDYYWLGVKELARCVGAACAARIARRQLRGAICAARCTRRAVARRALTRARSCAARTDAARLNSNVGLNSNWVRGAMAVNRH